MGWLTYVEALPAGHQKVRDLTSFMASRTYEYSLECDDEDIARAVHGMQTAAVMMRREWFFASIGVMDILDEHGEETYYLARSPDSHFFSTHNVVPWTNWLGSVYTALSEALRRGSYPKRLTYGPSTLQAERNVGPLVNYRFAQGVLVSADFHDVTTETARLTTEPHIAKDDFGLRDIVATMDTDQDSKLRAAMSGTFILTGGPGVGKTTVALHRLPYLINEQNAEGKTTTDHYADRTNLFFTPDTMLVVVWKEHLVPYLETCLKDLGLEQVRVQHIDAWAGEALKPHVPFGRGHGQYQRFEDPADMTAAKLSPSEEILEDFVLSEHALLQDLRGRYAELHSEVNLWLEASGCSRTKLIPPSYFTVDEVEAGFRSLTAPVDKQMVELQRRLKSFSDTSTRPTLQQAFNEGESLRQRVLGRLAQETARIRTSAVRLLMLFYESPQCTSAVASYGGPVSHSQLVAYVRDQKHASRLSQTDRYLLLWIIRLLAEHDASAEVDKVLPLKEYSHIVVDEAQYYHPLVLRLLHNLTTQPRKSMTIVGDLEQRISSDGGLAAWDHAGIVVPANNVQRLDTNYRWSRQVFGFLSHFRKAAGLRDALREPDVWYSQEGFRPDVVNCRTRRQECDALAQRINQIKTRTESNRWSIAVVLPFNDTNAAVKELIALLQQYDLRSRWASGQDLRESKDHVMLTAYDSVVGLEFDAVLLPGVDQVLNRSPREDAMRALWVAVTRARKYEWISGLEEDVHWASLFGRGEFEPYRKSAAAFLG